LSPWKKRGIAAGVGLMLLGAAFGGGFWLERTRAVALEAQLGTATHETAAARESLARAEVPLELCRAAAELGRANFGNARERLQAAQEAASKVAALRGLLAPIADALEAARRLDPEAKAKVEALLTDATR
jgi:hypothetical protein